MMKVADSNTTVEEPTDQRRVIRPKVDIISDENAVTLVANMPGVAEEDADLYVERNVLTIRGRRTQPAFEEYRPAYLESDVVDYEREFTISDEIDVAKIDASMKDGVLRVTLPKSREHVARKIEIKAE